MQKDQKIKIVVVGDGWVGKSYLCRAAAVRGSPTGIATVIDYHIVNVMHDFKYYTLTFWDTAGYDEYDRLRVLSYPQTDIFLICFSTNINEHRNSFESITKKWIPEINQHCPETPYFIVRTKDDLENADTEAVPLNETRKQLLVHGYLRNMKKVKVPFDIWHFIDKYIDAVYAITTNTNEQGQNLCNKVGGYKYMSCSALEYRGIEELIREIIDCFINPQQPNDEKKCHDCSLL